MGWVDARADMILQGAAPESVLAEQTKYADKPWYPAVLYPYDTPAILRFARNIFDFDPATVMSQVRCPVLAMFGGADPTIPVHASLRGFADYLHPHPEHGIAVFPNADHGLFVAQPTAGVARRDQTAPAYMFTITAFLDDRRSA
jgi:pimeloyl-ACP methyl ester carboxylesterase